MKICSTTHSGQKLVSMKQLIDGELACFYVRVALLNPPFLALAFFQHSMPPILDLIVCPAGQYRYLSLTPLLHTSSDNKLTYLQLDC